MEHIDRFASFGAIVAVAKDFWFVLAVTVVSLALGRFARWPPSHLALPILVWALKASLDGVSRWSSAHYSPVLYRIEDLFLAMLALGLVLLCVGVAAALQPCDRITRFDILAWIASGLAVVTVVVDWALLNLFLDPRGVGS